MKNHETDGKKSGDISVTIDRAVSYEKYLSETIAVGIFSTLAYLYSFKFEAAYLAHFGVDQQFVTLSVENILISLSVMVGSSWILYQIFDALAKLPWRREWLVVLLQFSLPMLFSILSIAGYLQTGVSKLTLLYLACALLLFVLSLTIPWINRKKYGTFFNAVAADVEAEATIQRRGLAFRSQKYVGRYGAEIIIVAIIVLPFFASYTGAQYASRLRTFSILEQGGSWLFVQKNNETLVFSGYNPATKELTGEIRLLSGEDLNNLILKTMAMDDPPKSFGVSH